MQKAFNSYCSKTKGNPIVASISLAVGTYGVYSTYKSIHSYKDAIELAKQQQEEAVKAEMELEKLTKYPTNVIEEFLKCVKLLKEDDINEDKYMGIIGYITMRLNFVELKTE